MVHLKQIGEVSRKLGLNPKTIRYYEEIKLIPEPQRNQSGYRVYTQDEVKRLSFVSRARSLDFSLDEIRAILELRDNGKAPCSHVTAVIKKRIYEINSKIAALSQLRHELRMAQERANSLSEDAVREDCICHLIEFRAKP